MTTEAVGEAGGSLPLEGIRVLELGGGVPAGFCTHLLAGFGADVVQVGDPGLTADEELYLSRGKRRVDVTPDDLAGLLERVTVVVDGRSPSAGDSGLPSAHELREQHPHLLVTVLTPFGLHGPHSAHRATNIVSFANGGIMAITGEPDRPPLQTGGDQALMLGGLHGFAATTVALVGALLQGEGDLIDISLQECAASMLEGHGSAWEYESVFDERAGNMFRAEWAVYPVMDGWAALCCLGRQVPTLLNVIGVEPETKFLDPVQRGDYNDELFVHVLQFMVAHTKDELTALSPVHKLPVGAVRTPADLVAHQPLVERGFFDPADSDGGGGAGGSLPGRPFPGLGWASLGPVASVPVDVVRGEWDSARVPA